MSEDIIPGNPDPRILSPREFLRTRRPEKFSDSVPIAKRHLDRLQLEYHLDTLTNRGQEGAFEAFARALAEREVCPNLLPHTGPVGGGDSKVDSETIPVAESLSLAWYGGFANEAASERWAFAFSAKKMWQPKLRADIQKIGATQRSYKKAFFVTNQYVPDKKRATLEDELSAIHKLDVRILDRTWILDAVFGNHREDLAIETLGLPESLRVEVQLGPLDTEREQRLAALDASVENGLRDGRRDSMLAEDAILSATTARGLDRPRVEVDGRFVRAKDLADRSGSQHERIEAAYQWAWTSFWWYEDFPRYAELVADTFDIAGNTDNSYHLELLTNLFVCLSTAIHQAGVDPVVARIEELGGRLREVLQDVTEEPDRPSNALHAMTLLLQVRLLTEPTNSESLLRELGQTIMKARHLVGYPFTATVNLIREMGEAFGDSPAYEAVFESVVTIAADRSGEITAAMLLLDRGTQRLQNDDHLGALRVIGRALVRLYKTETMSAMVRALYLAGAAYAQAGLLWAARGATLNAASLATVVFHKYGRITGRQVACFERMMWLELELGRLPQALQWYEVAAVASHALHEPGSSGDLMEGYGGFDMVLGVHFLKADLSTLRSLERLPDVLNERGLYFAKAALLFALGQPHQMPDDLFADEPPEVFFRKWRDQPAGKELETLTLGAGATARIESDILGCHVSLEHDSLPPGTALAESILSALEGIVATGLIEGWVAHEPLLRVVVRVTEYGEYPFSYRRSEDLGRPIFHVACRPFPPGSLSHDEQAELKRRLMALVVEMFAHVILVADDTSIATLIGEDMAIHRAIDFGGSFVVAENVLGSDVRTRIDQEFTREFAAYPLTRSEEWDAAERMKLARDAGEQEIAIAPDGSDRRNAPRPTSHSDVRTISLIRMPLWERAGWKGVLFVTPTTGHSETLPGMYLGFSDPVAAAAIFEGLIEDAGEDDVAEQIRIGVIRGVSAKNPAWYRMTIGNELTRDLFSEARMMMIVSRIHTMTPNSTYNVDRFLSSYAAHGRYFVAPAILSEEGGIEAMGRQRIMKRRLYVRQAWEIGLNDPDIAAIECDDDVVIPPEVQDAPVLKALSWKKARRKPSPQ